MLAFGAGGPAALEATLRAMEAAPLEDVVVVPRAGEPALAPDIDLHGARVADCERPVESESAALACGLAELGELDAVLVETVAGPPVTTEAIRRVLAARTPDSAVTRASWGGKAGHPLVIERELFDRLRDVTGDHGARNLLLQVPTREVGCDELGPERSALGEAHPGVQPA